MSHEPFKNRQPRDPAETLWQANYSAREDLFRSQFGHFPEQILKATDMFVVWPGGCLAEFDSPKLGGLRVTATFGLSNSDLPTTIKSSMISRSREGNVETLTSALSALPEPLPQVPGRAGYGYEFITLSKTPTEMGKPSFEVHLMHHLARHQFSLPRQNFLDTIEEFGAMTYDTGPDPQGRHHFYLFAPFWDLVRPNYELPGGSASLIAVVKIAPSELAFARENGPAMLLQTMRDRGILPISDPDRAPVV